MTFANLINTNEPHTRVFIQRLAPDKLLVVVAHPANDYRSPRLSGDPRLHRAEASDEQIALPTITPTLALINAPCVP
jgi:hypothetical protein